jgi:hypothetical protein
MKHYIGTVLVFLGSLFAISAQVITEQELNELLNSRIIQMDNPIIQNLTVIRQVQDENQIISIQEQQGSASNHVLVNQNGIGNRGYIEQTGSGLETYLWQYNANNEANLWSVGENIHTSVKQDGEGNVMNSYIENTGLVLRSAALLQEGNDNRIDLSLKGDGFGGNAAEQTVVINQNGNQHEVNAFMEPFSAPLEINQTPGVNGEGMKIDVSTSTFSFPLRK